MKRFLALSGALLVALTVALWVRAGANPGWTKTSAATLKTDPVTGLEYPEYEKRFVPGVEILVGGSLLGAALVAASLLIRRPPHHPPSQAA